MMNAETQTPVGAADERAPAAWLAALDARLATRSGEPEWLARSRREGRDRFAAVGLPAMRDEDWRFTNLEPLAGLEIAPTLGGTKPDLPAEALDGLPLAGLAGDRLVFVDGHFSAALSSVGALPEGACVEPLSRAIAGETPFVRERLTATNPTGEGAFAALNRAVFSDGACVILPRDAALKAPLHLLFVSTGQQAGAAVLPRNLILAEAGSRATILEHYVGLAEQPALTCAQTDLVAGDGARLEHLRFQEESLAAFHVGGLRIELGRDTFVAAHSFSLGAKLFRHEIRPRLAAEGAECVLNGLYLVRGRQLADHHMVVEHAQPHGDSHEYFNGILADEGRGVFHGRILVQPGAQKTDAKQTNKNLLLSDTARVNTKPQLEIYADDVRCTHGATIGQLDPEAVFYLRARGIPLETARRMLVHSFAGEITARIECEPAREELDQLVWDWLEGLDQVRVEPQGDTPEPAVTH